MEFLVAAVVLVGAISVVNILLTVGVVARLKEHTALLARSGHGAAAVLGVGEMVPEFTTTTVRGETLTTGSLGEETLVGFFSPSCDPCKELVPEFLVHAQVAGDRQGRPVAVVVGKDEGAAEFAARLSEVATVVVEDLRGPVSGAFGVSAFPSLVLVAPEGGGVAVRELEPKLLTPQGS
ncbi:TlpA family protein disulfide reductase [Actinocorallia longicatena]|uniref:TlpA family protein n=1 Tax=Actinocorallia longicatena TaxID=111803 RepID=A0ABP6Q9M4_9ACTN